MSQNAEDVQLVVTMLIAMLPLDLDIKAGLLARAAIPEYWVISLPERKIYVHTDPLNGKYMRHDFDEGDFFSLSFAPNIVVAVSDLLTKKP